jgi:hypothetical protein
LFGNGRLDYGEFNAFRVSVGFWCDPDLLFGAEAGGFLTENRGLGYARLSDPAGNPPTYYPIFQPQLGQEGSFTVSDPVLGPGATSIVSASQFLGAEANGLTNLCRNGFASVDLLYGFRYLDLDEHFRIQTFIQDSNPSLSARFDDRFGTRNQFYGGQIGLKGALYFGRCSLLARASIAAGDGHQVVAIAGNTDVVIAGQAPFSSVGGIFALPTNIGRHRRDQFTYVPEGSLKIGFDLMRNLRITGGYDILWWNEVVRPGEHVDRWVNRTQQFGGPLVGFPSPGFQWRPTEYWIHGFNAGLELIF